MSYIYDFNKDKIEKLSNMSNLKAHQAKIIESDDGKFKFEDIQLERFEDQLNGVEKERRQHQRGQSLAEELGYNKKVVIIRAVHSRTNTFKPLDYVMVNNGAVAPSAYSKMKGYLDEGDQLRTEHEKKVGWVASHAQTMAVSYGENHHVMVATVEAKDVYKATNNGEYFYDGEIKQGKIVFGVHEFGYFMSEKDMKAESSMEY